MSDFDGGAGGASGGDHDGYGHSCEGGVEGGGGGAAAGFLFGTLGHALACMGVTEGAEDAGSAVLPGCGRRVRLPGTSIGERSCQVLVWPHGSCDVNAVVSAVLSNHGFRNVNFKKSDATPSTRVDNTIRDTTPFDGPTINAPMPSGFLPGATGFTRTFTNHWQLPSKATWLSVPRVDPAEPVHLTVTSCTWFFNGPGDFETRVALSVFARQRLVGGEWRVCPKLVAKYVAQLRPVADDLFLTLSQYRASPHSVMVRQMQQPGPEAVHETPPAPAASASVATIGRPGVRSLGFTAGPDPMSFDHSV